MDGKERTMPLAILLTIIASVFGNAHHEDNLIDSEVASAFMVQIQGCTGSIIAEDWIITAAHCFVGLKNSPHSNVQTNQFGDYEIIFEEGDDRAVVYKPSGIHLDPDQFWTQPLSPGNSSEEARGGFWRTAEKVIVNGNFESEALSWKGHDLALIKLNPRKADSLKGSILPVCLSRQGLRDDERDNLYMAGFGRRFVPHCLTNEIGPDVFSVCGRPIRCSKDHRTRKCGVRFLYDGHIHKSCLNTSTPSAKEPICIDFRRSNEKLANSEKTVHIFNQDGSYNTSCYPKLPPSGTRGWCATRHPGVDEDSEPTFTSGWGFCSGTSSQAHCNSYIPDSQNDTAVKVSVLHSDFCKDKLEANLNAEQPWVERSSYEDLEGGKGIVCIGRNVSRKFSQDLFFVSKSSSEFKEVKKPSQRMVQQLVKKAGIQESRVNGGPSCFGDSGGPLFRISFDPEQGNKAVPELVGVFSFILWGTCQGNDEPGYYLLVDHYRDWILNYVQEKDLCWI